VRRCLEGITELQSVTPYLTFLVQVLGQDLPETIAAQASELARTVAMAVRTRVFSG
jgi:hypothetical protein